MQCKMQCRLSTVLEDHSLSIDTQLISDQEKRIRENRLKIRCIAETVIFCGRQGIAMHGHRDDGPAVQDNTCVVMLKLVRVQNGPAGP